MKYKITNRIKIIFWSHRQIFEQGRVELWWWRTFQLSFRFSPSSETVFFSGLSFKRPSLILSKMSDIIVQNGRYNLDTSLKSYMPRRQIKLFQYLQTFSPWNGFQNKHIPSLSFSVIAVHNHLCTQMTKYLHVSSFRDSL